LQNRLMRIPDREMALAMMYMEDTDRLYIFSKLSSAKARRIREEIGHNKGVHITYDQYKKTISHVIAGLSGRPKTEKMKSYLRPKRRRGR